MNDGAQAEQDPGQHDLAHRYSVISDRDGGEHAVLKPPGQGLRRNRLEMAGQAGYCPRQKRSIGAIIRTEPPGRPAGCSK